MSVGLLAIGRAALRVRELGIVSGLLRKRAEQLKHCLGELEGRTPSLDPGTYPLFVLEVDRLSADTDAAYWASRTEALLKMFAARQ